MVRYRLSHWVSEFELSWNLATGKNNEGSKKNPKAQALQAE